MFEGIPAAAPDPIFALTDAFRQDSNPQKINLGAGVYRDERGRTPALAVVKEAERRLWQEALHFPPPTAPQPSPAPDEPQPLPLSRYSFASILDNPETGAAEPGLDSRGTSEDERDDPARSRTS